MGDTFTIFPIGTISRGTETVRIDIEPRFADGLKGIADFSHIEVYYWLDRNDSPQARGTLQVHPKKDPDKPLTGVFATHSPLRPNLIARTVCRLDKVAGTSLYIEAIDAREGSPVIDIKGYLPESIDAGDLRLPAWLDT